MDRFPRDYYKRQSLFGQTTPSGNSTASPSALPEGDGQYPHSSAWRYGIVAVLVVLSILIVTRILFIKRRARLLATVADRQARDYERHPSTAGQALGIGIHSAGGGRRRTARDPALEQALMAAGMHNTTTFDRLAARARARVRAEGGGGEAGSANEAGIAMLPHDEASWRAAERAELRAARREQRRLRRMQQDEGHGLPTYTKETGEGEQTLEKAESVASTDSEDAEDDARLPPAYPPQAHVSRS